jgi:hypothetical protein
MRPKHVKTKITPVPAEQLKQLEAYAKIRNTTLLSVIYDAFEDHIECTIGAYYENREIEAGKCEPIKMN